VKFDQDADAENPFKRSYETIKSYAGVYFDPEVVEALAEVIVDHLIDESSPRIIIVDEESEELDALATRLKKNGVFPYVLGDTDKATNVLWTGPISLIVSEVNTQPMDGISFCKYVKTNEEYKNISFMFLSKENIADTIREGFEAGADDFVTKPYNLDILIPKINNLIRLETQKTKGEAESLDGKKGIAGNLAEVQVTDLIQMLSRGRQTGALKLFKDEEQGEIFFADGQVINARYNEREKEHAFNLLIRWEYGLFRLDHDAPLPQQEIHESTEMLLIEACRIWDEEKKI
jgi:response regulator RpfG family c-di-GMP phosphodiesterase